MLRKLLGLAAAGKGDLPVRRVTEKRQQRHYHPDLSEQLSTHFILREFIVSQTAARQPESPDFRA